MTDSEVDENNWGKSCEMALLLISGYRVVPFDNIQLHPAIIRP